MLRKIKAFIDWCKEEPAFLRKMIPSGIISLVLFVIASAFSIAGNKLICGWILIAGGTMAGLTVSFLANEDIRRATKRDEGNLP